VPDKGILITFKPAKPAGLAGFVFTGDKTSLIFQKRCISAQKDNCRLVYFVHLC
jgi:hypothetical protein